MRMRTFNIQLNGVLKIVIREHGGDVIFKEIMADNFKTNERRCRFKKLSKQTNKNKEKRRKKLSKYQTG